MDNHVSTTSSGQAPSTESIGSTQVSSLAGQAKKITIYYDGVCNLCSGIMGTIDATAKDKGIAGVDASNGVLPQGVTMAEAMRDVHAVDETGTIHKGIDAVFLVFDQYPYLTYLARFGRLPGVYVLSKAIYRIVEKSRYYIWGRKR